MRLLGKLSSVQKGNQFSSYLSSKGIEHKVEVTKESDWGNDAFGTHVAEIWIINEDDFQAASKLLQEFYEKPDVAVENASPERIIPNENESPPTEESYQEVAKKLFTSKVKLRDKPVSTNAGRVTVYLLMICAWIFIVSKYQAPSPEPIPAYLPPMAYYSSNITKHLLFDYPQTYQIADQLIADFGLQKLENPRQLPPQGILLLGKLKNTPYWQGFYDKVVDYLSKGKAIAINSPMVEKIREGQVWRLFTPCLLHSDIFHLFFNMAWLLILGRQMESRMGVPRYLLFILITGIVSNTAQYLMSGPNFLGFSGILCAMIVFIWFRQKQAPWEGYNLPASTMGLITVFILLMFGVQFAAFITEVVWNKEFLPRIANTAHLTGALAGYILAKTHLFNWKP